MYTCIHIYIYTRKVGGELEDVIEELTQRCSAFEAAEEEEEEEEEEAAHGNGTTTLPAHVVKRLRKSARKSPLPVTVLSGFLGAGKVHSVCVERERVCVCVRERGGYIAKRQTDSVRVVAFLSLKP